MTTRHQVHLKHRIVICLSYHTIFQQGFLGIGALLIVGIALVLFLVTHQPVLERSLEGLRTIFYYRPVGFMHLSLGKHLVQSGKRFRGSGKHHQP